MYLGRLDPAMKASHAEAEGLRQLAARECFHSDDEFVGAHLLHADPSGIPSARHVTNPVHSALKGEHSGVEPGGHQVVWLQPSVKSLATRAIWEPTYWSPTPILRAHWYFSSGRSRLNSGRFSMS